MTSAVENRCGCRFRRRHLYMRQAYARRNREVVTKYASLHGARARGKVATLWKKSTKKERIARALPPFIHWLGSQGFEPQFPNPQAVGAQLEQQHASCQVDSACGAHCNVTACYGFGACLSNLWSAKTYLLNIAVV